MSKRKGKTRRRSHVYSEFFGIRVIPIGMIPNIVGRAGGHVIVGIVEVISIIIGRSSVLDKCQGFSCKVLSRLR
jgi:hypothetical protein